MLCLSNKMEMKLPNSDSLCCLILISYYLSCFYLFHIKLTFYKHRFFNSSTLFLIMYSDITGIGMTCCFHISTLTSYVSSSINFHTSRIPWINTFQVIMTSATLLFFRTFLYFVDFRIFIPST